MGLLLTTVEILANVPHGQNKVFITARHKYYLDRITNQI